MRIVVIGGSGRVGSNVVRRLAAKGHEAVPASPATGVDTITGEGLAEVMAGADVVVDVSNAPVWEDDAVLEFFTTSTRNLLAAERAPASATTSRCRSSGPICCRTAATCARRSPRRPRSRLGGSRTRSCARRSSSSSCPRSSSPAPRATAVRLSSGLMQFVAADDVAATVAELAVRAPVGGRVELGGPEALGLDAWARRLFAATGDERQVIADPHARYFGTELHGGELTPGADAHIGAIDFDGWFATHAQEARR